MVAGEAAAYLPIRDYALIGNAETAALVGSNGSIDWFCHPRFDSPAMLCKLLDAARGGSFSIRPVGAWTVERQYAGPTAVLRTVFKASEGVVRLTDFMPRRDAGGAATCLPILRLVEGLGGTVELEVRFHPTLQFAAVPTALAVREGGALARGGDSTVSCWAPVPLRPDGRGGLTARRCVREGERRWFGLGGAVADEGTPAMLREDEADRPLQHTPRLWEDWSGRCTCSGPYAGMVLRSAVTLKLLTYEPTGAVVAAPTTSLPEEIGGTRNWDYRYAWLRDAALILHALQSLGQTAEAVAFFRWLEQQCIECLGDVQIMYAVDGDPELLEELLTHLEGYRGSRPVRVGNAASLQRQLDIYGEVLDAAHFYVRRIGAARPELPEVLWLMANRAAEHWHEPDRGIWEVRGGSRHFLHSKLYCWVAVDRGLQMQKLICSRGDVAAWERAHREIREAILAHGWDEGLGAFVQAFGEPVLDASALLLPLVGFLPATDPRCRSTVARIRERLTSHGLVYRYLPADGLPGGEGAFLLCSLWLVDNLTLAGQLEEAHALYEQILGCANDVGLFSEEVDPISRELLGNFPQGFTHLGVIRSAVLLGEQGSSGGW